MRKSVFMTAIPIASNFWKSSEQFVCALSLSVDTKQRLIVRVVLIYGVKYLMRNVYITASI